MGTHPLARRDDNAPDLSAAAQKRTRERQSLNPLRTVSTILNGEPLLRLLALSLFLHAILFMGLIGTIGTYLAEYMGFGNYELAYVTGTCASARLACRAGFRYVSAGTAPGRNETFAHVAASEGRNGANAGCRAVGGVHECVGHVRRVRGQAPGQARNPRAGHHRVHNRDVCIAARQGSSPW
jgi:hypothetical protein